MLQRLSVSLHIAHKMIFTPVTQKASEIVCTTCCMLGRLQQTWAGSGPQLLSQQSDKPLSHMQNSLGNLFFRTSTERSPGFGFPCQCCEVCSNRAGSRAPRKASALGFSATIAAVPWLLPLGVTGCHRSAATLHPGHTQMPSPRS